MAKAVFVQLLKNWFQNCRFAKPIGNFLNEGIYKIVRENRKQTKERCDFCNYRNRYDFIIYSKAVNNDEGQTNDKETSELRDLKIEKLGNKNQISWIKHNCASLFLADVIFQKNSRKSPLKPIPVRTRKKFAETIINSGRMLISAVHHENGEEKLRLLMVDSHIPAGAKKLYWLFKRIRKSPLIWFQQAFLYAVYRSIWSVTKSFSPS